MGLFKHKNNNAKKIEEDKNLIQKNIAQLNYLIELIEIPNIKNELISIKEKVDYLSNSSLDNIYELDKKFNSICLEIKMEASKAKEKINEEIINKKIKELKLNLTNREAYTL